MIDFKADMLIISIVQLSVSFIVFEFDLPVDVFELISWCCSFLGKYLIHISSFLASFCNLYAYVMRCFTLTPMSLLIDVVDI